MYLYSLTLQRATGAVCAVIGSFCGRDAKKAAASGSASEQEIAVARGSTLDFLRPDPEYFDTVPVTSAICVLRSGFLFAASEFGNHALYQFRDIGRDADVESSSAALMETEEGCQPVFFQPRRSRTSFA